MKKVKSEASLDLSCDRDKTMLSGDSMLSQVKTVEQKLQIESSEQIDESLTNEELQTAAEMFLYLIICPNTAWLKSWSSFYKDLFLTQPADKMILTLNRIMKTETSHDKDGKLQAGKLLKRTSNLLSLSFDNIQSLLPEKKSRNGSLNRDLQMKDGKIFFDFVKVCFQ